MWKKWKKYLQTRRWKIIRLHGIIMNIKVEAHFNMVLHPHFLLKNAITT